MKTNSRKHFPVGASQLDVKLSAYGSTVGFVADKEVYVVSTTDSDQQQQPKPHQATIGFQGCSETSYIRLESTQKSVSGLLL